MLLGILGFVTIEMHPKTQVILHVTCVVVVLVDCNENHYVFVSIYKIL